MTIVTLEGATTIFVILSLLLGIHSLAYTMLLYTIKRHMYDCGHILSHSAQVVNCKANNVYDQTMSHQVSHQDWWCIFIFDCTM